MDDDMEKANEDIEDVEGLEEIDVIVPSKLRNISEFVMGVDASGKPCKILHSSVENYIETSVKFEHIYNLPRSNIYVLEVFCRGSKHGEIDLDPMKKSATETGDGIVLKETITVRNQFQELVDNPLLFKMMQDKDDPLLINQNNLETYYGTLDVVGLFENSPGQISDLTVYLIKAGAEPTKAPNPELLISVSCKGGLPGPKEMRKGNILRVTLESMMRIPPEIADIAKAHPNSEINAFFTIPYEDPNDVMIFPSGKYSREIHSNEKKTDFLKSRACKKSEEDEEKKEETQNRTTYWASVQEAEPEVPPEAIIVNDSNYLPPLMTENIILGDMEQEKDSTWKSYIKSPDAKIVWSSSHKKYMDVDVYKKFLAGITKSLIWPIEVSMTLTRDKGADKGSEETIHNSESAAPSKIFLSQSETPLESLMKGMQANKKPKASVKETIIIYHGLALVDFSDMLKPGINRGVFACKLVSFTERSLQEKTCLWRSAFLEFMSGNISSTTLTTQNSFLPENESSFAMKRPKSRKPLHRSMKLDSKGLPGSPDNENLKYSQTYNEENIPTEDTYPFILLEIEFHRSIIPLITEENIKEDLEDYIPPREIPKKFLMSADMAEEKFRRAILEACIDLSQEFNYYLKRIIGTDNPANLVDTRNPSSSFDSIKKGFLFYLNASGRYLVMREHLRSAVTKLVQQRAFKLKEHGFPTSRDFHNYLHDIFIHLVEQMHEVLSAAHFKEVDNSPQPNRFSVRNQKYSTDPQGEKSATMFAIAEHARSLSNLLWASEEAFAQGDYKNCQRLHLQRISQSLDSPVCWLDFAIMWLHRSQYHLAEVAIRESLSKTKKNVISLIVAAVLAMKKKDDRAISFLTLAESMYPYSPEIQVLQALYYAMSGNEAANQLCLKKARYFHHIMTGEPTAAIEREFRENSETFLLKTATSQLDSIVHTPSSKDSEKMTPSEIDRVLSVVKLSQHSTKRIYKPSGKTQYDSFSSESLAKAINKSTINVKRNSQDWKNLQDALRPASPNAFSNSPNSFIPEAKAYKHLGCLEPELNLPESFDADDLKKALLPDVQMLCLFATWDCTENIEDRKNCNLNRSGSKISMEDPSLHPDSTMTSQMEKEKLSTRASASINTEQTWNLKEDTASTYSTPSSSIILEPKKPVVVKKEESEFIWTAQLLLKIGAYNLLDAVMARQMSHKGGKSLPFLYLRGISLLLRKQEKLALQYFDSAIAMEPEVDFLRTLKGHCYYSMNDTENAVECYDKALKLHYGAENRHLLFLRFGAIALKKGEAELAKRLFLAGVQKQPSPYMWLGTGNSCYAIRQFEEAETAFSEANRLDHTSPLIWGHLALVSLMRGNPSLAEQSYKWALRFGLQPGKLLEEIKRVQAEKGFGDPSFPRVPSCIPHEYYLQRIGRIQPFTMYQEALKLNKRQHHGKKKTDLPDLNKRRLDSKDLADKAIETAISNGTRSFENNENLKENSPKKISTDIVKKKKPKKKSLQ